jgi:acyl carrier protein
LESGEPRSPTLERIESVVRNLLNDYEIVLTPSTRPADVPGWDSLASIAVLFAVEEEFGVRVEADPADIPTVGELAARVDEALRVQS